jgi:tetratricopeptide (TPR) repeat protein
MFTLVRFSLLLAILWPWPIGLHAQSGALLEANRRGTALYQSGQYDKAIPFSRKALELGEKEFGPNHPAAAALLNVLAQTYLAAGKYAEAEPLYGRA